MQDFNQISTNEAPATMEVENFDNLTADESMLLEAEMGDLLDGN